VATLDTARMSASLLARFSEPVTLHTGAVILAVVDLPMPRPRSLLEGADRITGYDEPVGPSLTAPDADLGDLRRDDVVVMRGLNYVVVRRNAPCTMGLTLVDLLPERIG